MEKVRIYALSKELGVENKEVLGVLQNVFGITGKTSHSSSIENETAEKVREYYKKRQNNTANTQNGTVTSNNTAADEKNIKTDKKNHPQSEQITNNSKQRTEQRTSNTQQRTEHRTNTQQRHEQKQNTAQPQRQIQRTNTGQQQRQTQRTNAGQQQNQTQRANAGQQQNQTQRANAGQQQRQGQRLNSGQTQRTGASQRQGSAQMQRTNQKLNIPQVQKPEQKSGTPQAQKPKTEQNKNQEKSNKPQKKEEFQNRPGKSNMFGQNTNTSAGKKNKKSKADKKNKRKAKEMNEDREVNNINNLNNEDDIKIVQLPSLITVKDLSEKLGKSSSEVVMKLMKMGMMVNINEEIEYGIANSICEEFDIIAELAPEIDLLEEAFREEEDDPANMTERPPVVVVMGHVDHGKTSLLDAIRHSSVTAREAGGITQHIGAYTVAIGKKPITFLDTPGHEAFTAMRMRGAQVTDIAVLVVAADDGVMPQTIEAINHAKAAGVEIIVAINKIDKESANPDRVKQELTEYGLLAEDWGGQTICVPVSAVTKKGIDQLLEMIILAAEMKELKANPNKKARGTIIEAQLDKGRGPVATVLVQNGTLNVGDPIVAGSCYGKIRAMMNDKGQKVKKAGPSMPVEILGLSEVPSAGDMFYAADSEKQARHAAESVVAKGRIDMIKETPQKVSLDDLFDQIQSGNMKELNIVIKADVQGSVEAVRGSLEKLSNTEVRINTIHGGVGAVTESDVMLASASNAIIIGFNVRPEATAKVVAEDQKVDVRLYRVIYNAIEDITAAMKGMLDPVYEEKVIGHAEIRQLFKASGVGTIGGSYITDGKFTRNAKVRIIRNGTVVYDGELTTLRRFKDDVKEVNAGYECGLLFNKYNDIKESDQVEAYIMEEIKQ